VAKPKHEQLKKELSEMTRDHDAVIIIGEFHDEKILELESKLVRAVRCLFKPYKHQNEKYKREDKVRKILAEIDAVIKTKGMK